MKVEYLTRVSESACFGVAPGIFFLEPALAQAPVTEDIGFLHIF